MITFTRRQFGRLSSLTLVSLLVSSWMSCEKATTAIGDLRGILNAVETALKALNLLSGLLPEAVNKGAAYLLAVCQFVDDVGRILENDAINAIDKTRQILSWAAQLPLVSAIPEPIQTIARGVATAVDKFLSIFGTDAEHAGSVARARMDNPPDWLGKPLDAKSKDTLHAIEADAEKDKAAVEAWQNRALITPHSN